MAQYFLAPDHSYLEIDLDVHSYAYLARKAFHAFIPRLATVIFENGFVIQAREQQLQAFLTATLCLPEVYALSWTAFCPAQHVDECCVSCTGKQQ